MPKYLVKNKYTYEKVRQSDYTYASDRWEPSQNVVEGRFLYETAGAIGYYELAAGGTHEVSFNAEQAGLFASVSGLMLSGVPGATVRVTLWGEAGESFSTVAMLTDAPRLYVTVKMAFLPVRMTLEAREDVRLTISLGYVLNTLGEVGGQAHFYRTEGAATLADDGGALVWTLSGAASLTSPSFPDSSDTVYNMKMPRRNTVVLVITNRSTARHLILAFATTTHPWGGSGALEVELAADDQPHAYYLNLSALPAYCDGRLSQFQLRSEGTGDIIIHRYTFEQEKIIREAGAEILSCEADLIAETITVRGRMLRNLAVDAPAMLNLYTTTMADEQDTPAGKTLIASCPLPAAGETFELSEIPLRDECTTRLPYQLVLFARCGDTTHWLCDRFYIENYEDFDESPYAFDLPDYTVVATDFGAKGDAIHNDTDAIQAALDHVAAHGGGKVILPGSPDRYGRRYIATNILMPSMTELCIEEGAVLWQSQLKEDYPYAVAYGHDGVIPGINWAHNLHVSNLPLIQAANVHHVKITGKGSIRMMDTGSEEGVGMPGYATGCPDRIHLIPIGFFAVEDCECRDFEIIRSNNYHTEYNHCRRVYLANLRLHEVKCVSGDGFGMAGGQDIFVNRCFFQSNDDGIVMSTHLHDPRGILWWTNFALGEDNSCRRITTAHSYLNSGGGKALAFITWGTCDPNQEMEEISDIVAYDNVLTSVNPVGTWPDNPYNGKVPFDNTETNDYSPIKDVRIFGNRYNGNCTLGPIACTNVLTDCGVHSASQFRNGDFTLGGMANWTKYPNAHPESVHAVVYADKVKGCIEHFEYGEVSAAQGLHLLAGTHTATMELLTGPAGAILYVERMLDGELIAAKAVSAPRPTEVSLTFTLDDCDAEDVLIGIRSIGQDPADFAVFDHCVIHSAVDKAAIARRREAAFMAAVRQDFDPMGFAPHEENGKMLLSGTTDFEAATAEAGTVLLPVLEPRELFAIEAAIRADHYNPAHEAYGFGYRFSADEDGRSYRELRFNAAKRTLTLANVTSEGTQELYRRTHFFFTSNDFHIFRLEVGREEVAVWIDGAQYAVIPCPGIPGRTAFFMTDARVSLCNLKLI